jgi:hypothetical protein
LAEKFPDTAMVKPKATAEKLSSNTGKNVDLTLLARTKMTFLKLLYGPNKVASVCG